MAGGRNESRFRDLLFPEDQRATSAADEFAETSEGVAKAGGVKSRFVEFRNEVSFVDHCARGRDNKPKACGTND